MRHEEIKKTQPFLIAIAIVVVITGIFAFEVGVVDAAEKEYTATISPTSCRASSINTYNIVITDTKTDGIGVNYATISYDLNGFSEVTVTSVIASNGGIWASSISSNVIMIEKLSGDALAQGQYVTVVVSATAPPSSGAKIWTTSARESSGGSSHSLSGIDPVVNVFVQYQVTPYYTRSDSSSPTVTNVVSYTQFGNVLHATPTLGNSGGTAIWVDEGTAVTYNSPIPSSPTTQRWQVSSTDSGTYTAIASVSSSGSATVNYYHQYKMTFSYGITNGGEPSAPSLTIKQFGTTQIITLTKSATGYFCDASSNWFVPEGINGFSGTEDWKVFTSNYGSVTSSQTISLNYYHIYKITFSYQIIGGGTPTGPSFHAKLNGGYFYEEIPPGGKFHWYDANSPWDMPTQLTGSTGTERWKIDQSNSGTINAAQTFIFIYNHQYAITASLTYIGAEPNYPDTAMYVYEGSPISTAVQYLTRTPQTVWLKSGGTWSTPLSMNLGDGLQRWIAPSGTSGTVTSTTTINPHYYYQRRQYLSYSLVGSGSSNPPIFSAKDMGNTINQQLTTSSNSYWHDCPSNPWSVTNPITISSGNERWQSKQTTSGTVLPNGDNIVFTYYRQFKINLAATTGGSITTPTSSPQWYDSGTSNIALTATANLGYYFTSWTTSAPITITNPSSASSTMTITGTGTATANFAPSQVTTLDVKCDPQTVNREGSMLTSVKGTLTVGSSPLGGKTITLTYNDGTQHNIGSANTLDDGTYSCPWTVPSTLSNGFYVVKAEYLGDNHFYQPCNSQTTSNPEGGGLHVVPEYLLGGLAALMACFVGLAIFKKQKSTPQLFQH